MLYEVITCCRARLRPAVLRGTTRRGRPGPAAAVDDPRAQSGTELRRVPREHAVDDRPGCEDDQSRGVSVRATRVVAVTTLV